ncbi:hypothetical protein TAMA11512_24540 [Selenomonas sp. TAMA-11512]|uniref:RNA-binding cell elongation regulator Jag/EloR n=1 Tax=Selenomonas sp. TAMA-11512 TaxID=3095337 RepID=UPI00308A998E|nr:hypothetical protein TAMA11512_24540 [Selenomonas sp. TAMA-11512]
MSSIEKTGKSIEEAKEAALRELGIEEEDARIEILSVPSAGFFGIFGKRDAKVRVTKKAAPKAETTVPAASVERPAEPERRRIDIEEIATKPLDERAEERESSEPSRRGGYRQGYANDDSDDGDRRSRRPYRELTIDPAGPVQKGREFLEKILASMHLEVRIEEEMRPNGALLNIFGNNLGILIGKHGQTLDSLQYLTNLAANQDLTDERVRIVIDIEGYRTRREDTLRRLASRLAEKVRRTRQRVVLEPMNRHERKVIHMALTDEHNILSYSAGDEPYRKVVIEPKHGGHGYRRSHEERGSREEHSYDSFERSDRE